MPPRLYWVDLPEVSGRVAITTRPRAVPYLDEDVAHWRSEGLSAVASLLEPAEAAKVGLATQGDVMRAAGVVLVALPVGDHGVPASMADYAAAVETLAARVIDGQRIACHCFAGLGRSPMLAAGVLIRLGLEADEALARLGKARQVQVPETQPQVDWIMDYATRWAPLGRTIARES